MRLLFHQNMRGLSGYTTRHSWIPTTHRYSVWSAHSRWLGEHSYKVQRSKVECRLSFASSQERKRSRFRAGDGHHRRFVIRNERIVVKRRWIIRRPDRIDRTRILKLVGYAQAVVEPGI